MKDGIWDYYKKDTSFVKRIVYKENEQITLKLAMYGEIPITPGEEPMMSDPKIKDMTFGEMIEQLQELPD